MNIAIAAIAATISFLLSRCSLSVHLIILTTTNTTTRPTTPLRLANKPRLFHVSVFIVILSAAPHHPDPQKHPNNPNLHPQDDTQPSPQIIDSPQD